MVEGKHKLRFTSNHDECAWHDTPIGLYGGLDASIAAFAATLFYPGVPLLYTGQEIGLFLAPYTVVEHLDRTR